MTFQHKNIRLNAAKYRGRQWYFVTLCCAERRRVFAIPRYASWIIGQLGEHAASHNFGVHAYCAMPDHLHALGLGLETTSDLLAFLKGLKQETAYEFKKALRGSLWQKKFYDHILRQTDSVEGVAAYIWMNPVRAGLCEDPREYPYSGSLTLDWKRMVAPNEAWVPPWKGEKGKAPA